MNTRTWAILGAALALVGCGSSTGGVGGGAGGGSGGGTAGGAGGGTGGGAATAGYVATLTGAREVPPTTSTATGTATMTLDSTETTITWNITHTVTAPTGGHIHTGFAYESGNVAISLGTVLTSPITGSAAITAAQVADLKAGKLYVNLHTAGNPNGELRGQLLKPSEKLYRATMTGAEEVPPVTSSGTGALQVVLSSDSTKVNCHGFWNGIASVSAAHVHQADAGVAGPVAFPLTIDSTTGSLSCADQAVTAPQVSALNAGGMYSNVHSAAHTDGEVRGQLTPQ